MALMLCYLSAHTANPCLMFAYRKFGHVTLCIGHKVVQRDITLGMLW